MTRFPSPTPFPAPTSPAVFLDRDDTLIQNSTLPSEAFPGVSGDLFLPEFVNLLPGTRDACISLVQAGFVLVVVTNQASIARGGATESTVSATNARMIELLGDSKGSPLISAVYAAPHHPQAAIEKYRGDHPWRKPNPGMLLAAAEDLNLDLAASWLVGDAERDTEAGIAAGLHPSRCIRVGPEGELSDLAAAAKRILAHKDDPIRHATAEISAGPASTATLRAHAGSPLADAKTRATVESVAHSIAERTGVRLLHLQTDDQSITATLATHRLAALAFMAELRRATNTWHEGRGGDAPLWPKAPAQD